MFTNTAYSCRVTIYFVFSNPATVGAVIVVRSLVAAGNDCLMLMDHLIPVEIQNEKQRCVLTVFSLFAEVCVRLKL